MNPDDTLSTPGATGVHSLSHRLVELQEKERRQIARELHDEIGQLLTRLELILELGSRSPAEQAHVRIRDALALASELSTRVREMSLELRPAMLEDLGLLPALLWHFERYSHQTGVRVLFRHSEVDRRFSLDTETTVFRIIQEALTNVARHAGAGEVTVRLWERDGALGVQIEDRGVGFDPDAVKAFGISTGIGSMRERALLAGGQLLVESRPGAGTVVTAELPSDRA